MDEKEIKKIVATYFGFTPSIKIGNKKIRITQGEDIDGDVNEVKKIRIRWEEHIGNLSGAARVSPLDIMKITGMEYSEENYRKAVEIMKGIAKREGVYFVEIVGEDKYLLINPRYKR